MTFSRRRALVGLAALGLAGRRTRAVAPLPADLVGVAAAPQVAWSLDGFGPNLTAGGFATAEGPWLLVASDRLAGEPPRAGDVSLVSPRGWLVRRIVLPAERRGLPALLRSLVLATDADGTLHLLPLGRTARESLHPRLATGRPARFGPLVVGRHLLVSSGNVLASITDRLEIRWQAELGAPPSGPPGSDGSVVYAAAGSFVRALDGERGDLLWEQTLPAAATSAVLVSAGLVLAGGADGVVRALDAADGREVWQAPGGDGLTPYPALAGPWLIAGNAAGELRAWDMASGEPTWADAVPGPAGSPLVAFGHVVTIGGDGALHARPLAPGQPGWRHAPPDGERFTGLPGVFGRRVYAGTDAGRLIALHLEPATGPAPWPMAGGTLQRAGRVVPTDEADR